MKKITKNSIFLFLGCFLFLNASASFAGSIIKSSLPIFGDAKYSDDFSNFDYVNPNAPKGGRIVMPAYGGFDNFNPYIFKGNASGEVAGLLNDTLGVVPSDDVSTVYPLIAKEFELPSDNSFVGFVLDKRAKFHDGTPITADDVEFSFKSLVEKGSPIYKIYYADVEKVQKLAKNHIRFIFKKNSNNKELPLILAQLPVFSKKYWEDKDFAKPELKPQLGNGAYKVKSFEASKYIVLERVPSYWAKDIPSRKGFFNFDELRFDYYQDTTVTLQALFAGNIDVREEYIAKIWATGYENDLLNKQKIKKEEIKHNRPAVLQNFGFNLRKDKFSDPKVRQAIGLVFNFEWANNKLFYNQYSRIYSYFTNSGMEAIGKPQGRELEILKDLGAEEVYFAEVPQPPIHYDFMSSRQKLREAVYLLKDAGYDFVDGKMTNLKTNQPLEFEVLSNSANGSSFTRVMLPFIKNLEKIGIKASFRSIEVNAFKNRLDNFDFDVAILSYGISQLPGNEQKEMWGSQSRDVKGSYNYLGVSSKLVDEILKGLVQPKDKDDYEAHVRALDRVLRHGHYMIPQWYSSVQRVAYWDKFNHPKTDIKVGFQPHTWWMK